MSRINPDVDIIKDVLEAVLKAQPLSSFTQSLLQQYTERGGLSKKQLQGLYSKAQKINTISTAKLATLEAIILRKHSKHKSELPENTPLYTKNEENGKMIESILAKYPQHKRVLYLKSKYDNDEPFNTAEQLDLEKFTKLLIK